MPLIILSQAALNAAVKAALDPLSAQVTAMATDLDNAVSAFNTSLASLKTDMNKAFTDLEAAVAAGNLADVQSAVTALGALNAQVQAMDASALAADATTTPPPGPPTPPASAR